MMNNGNTTIHNNQPEESKRAKARWAILRNALLSSTTTCSHQKHSPNSNATTSDDKYDNSDNDESKVDRSSTSSNYSIHRFKGFHLLNRKVIADEQFDKNNNDKGEDRFQYVEYEIPLRKQEYRNINQGKDTERALKIRIKEKKQNTKQKIDLKELMSHQRYGVDNTGNTRVWECSMILAYLLISSSSKIESLDILHTKQITKSNESYDVSCSYLELENLLKLAQPKIFEDTLNKDNEVNQQRLRVIELGAGMAALPALSLAAVALGKKSLLVDEETKIPFMDIVITDGHPNSVKNNVVCSKLTLDLYGANYEEMNDGERSILKTRNCSIQTQLLLWKTNSEGVRECQELLHAGQCDNDKGDSDHFDIIFVSDCIHFTEFHACLMATIGRLLRIGGACLLCQPKRGRSLDQFIQLIDEVNNSNSNSGGENQTPLFEKKLYHEYDEEITKQHNENKQKNKLYDPNIHYPVILTMKKLRRYNEGVDTVAASNHVEKRNYSSSSLCSTNLKKTESSLSQST